MNTYTIVLIFTAYLISEVAKWLKLPVDWEQLFLLDRNE